MNDCKGIFGKLFGHDFDKFMIKDPAITYKFTDATISNEIAKAIFENNFTVYEIRCKRCGCKADE